MTPWGKGIDRFAARGRLLRALVLAAMLIQVLAGPATAQMFSDQPPPVPPGSVPDPGGAISLAPPSGPGSVPTMPAPLTQPSLTQPSLTQPSIAALPPVAAPQGAAPPGQAVLSLTARYGKDLPAINAGRVWRPCHLWTGQRGAAGDPEVRNRPRGLPASGGRPADRRPRRHVKDPAEPDFVRDLQGQPV